MQFRIVLLLILVVRAMSLKTTRRENLRGYGDNQRAEPGALLVSNDLFEQAHEIEEKFDQLRKQVFEHEKSINKLASSPIGLEVLLNQNVGNILSYEKDHELYEEPELGKLLKSVA